MVCWDQRGGEGGGREKGWEWGGGGRGSRSNHQPTGPSSRRIGWQKNDLEEAKGAKERWADSADGRRDDGRENERDWTTTGGTNERWAERGTTVNDQPGKQQMRTGVNSCLCLYRIDWSCKGIQNWVLKYYYQYIIYLQRIIIIIK
jgi:hypothetical protein